MFNRGGPWHHVSRRLSIGISEANLGGVGGRPEIGPFLKGEAGAWLGRAQKPTCRLPGFLGPNEMLHFGHLLVVFDGFHRVSNAETL